MRILAVSDEEVSALWEYYQPGRLDGYDLILSCGDLKAKYLEFLVTMARCPLLYVHGNHDGGYERKPPQGCDCIEDKLVVYRGLRILGLGGSRRYHPGPHQYTDRQMRKRIRKLRNNGHIEFSQKGFCLKIYICAVGVWNPFTRISVIIKIKH